jgi:hypothetical protein
VIELSSGRKFVWLTTDQRDWSVIIVLLITSKVWFRSISELHWRNLQKRAQFCLTESTNVINSGNSWMVQNATIIQERQELPRSEISVFVI